MCCNAWTTSCPLAKTSKLCYNVSSHKVLSVFLMDSWFERHLELHS